SRATLLLHHLSVAIYVSHTVSPLIPTLSLHDALPISRQPRGSVQAVPLPHHHELHRGVPEGVEPGQGHRPDQGAAGQAGDLAHRDRKSTRLNSSHVKISYAVFCLKKKKSTANSERYCR